MRINWTIHRNRIVTAYLISLREQGVTIRQAIARLPADGIPAHAVLTEEPDTWYWEEADHAIYCVKVTEQKILRITHVQKLTTETKS